MSFHELAQSLALSHLGVCCTGTTAFDGETSLLICGIVA
jgi:hypothetical protein